MKIQTEAIILVPLVSPKHVKSIMSLDGIQYAELARYEIAAASVTAGSENKMTIGYTCNLRNTENHWFQQCLS